MIDVETEVVETFDDPELLEQLRIIDAAFAPPPSTINADARSALIAVDAAMTALIDAHRLAKRRRSHAHNENQRKFTPEDKHAAAAAVMGLRDALGKCQAHAFDDADARELIAEASLALARTATAAGCYDPAFLLPRHVACCWPRIAKNSAAVRFGDKARAERRRRLFGRPFPFRFEPRVDAADASAAPYGLNLSTPQRRKLRREGYPTEIPLTPLQFRVVEMLIDAARTGQPCASDVIASAWLTLGKRGSRKKPPHSRLIGFFVELRQLLAPLEIRVRSARYLGYYLAPSIDRPANVEFDGGQAPQEPGDVGELGEAAGFEHFLAQAHAAATTIVAPTGTATTAFLGLTIDRAAGVVTRPGYPPVSLSTVRLNLLEVLAAPAGAFVSGEQLATAWRGVLDVLPKKGTILAECGWLDSTLRTLGIAVDGNTRRGRRLVDLDECEVAG